MANEVKQLSVPPKPSKYKAVKTDGYSSKAEAARAAELKLLERSGQIKDLQEQVRFNLIPAQYIDGKCVERACDFVADFSYLEPDGMHWRQVVEDKKGFRTPVYRLKKKMMLHVHKIRVKET